MTGQRFGRLVVIERAEDYIYPSGMPRVRWLCQCDCGNQVVIKSNALITNHTRSCGCLHDERISKYNTETKKKYNQYDLSNEYGIGYTLKGEVFYFDLEDYDKIKDHCWFIDAHGYVKTNIRDDKQHHLLSLHRLVMNHKGNRAEVDHINHDKFDNRKCNLRITTRSQNQMNKKMMSNNTSGVIGVSFNITKQKWESYIGINGETKFLGSFVDKDEAIKIRKEAESLYFNEYSYDNSQKICKNIQER